ncbi:MAG: hypothetical protein EXR71_14165 [Myxococcales bacterium]|nr:hypothetical protein [Myxococcales bacterium]
MRYPILFFLALGCASTATDDGTDTDGDTDTDTDTGPVDDADDAEHAVPLDLDMLDGDTLHDGDVDWYSVVGTAGQPFRIQVTNEDEKIAEDSLDTVVEVVDASGVRIAWEDDHPVGDVSTYDTVCFGFFPADGTYYVKVMDIGVFSGSPREVESTAYNLTWLQPTSPPDEPDSLLDISLAYDMQNDNSWYAIPVLSDAANDVDYVKLTIAHAGGTLALAAAHHIESSSYQPAVQVFDAEAQLVLDVPRIAESDLRLLLAPTDTQYELAVIDSAAGIGPTSAMWIFVANYAAPETSRWETEPNDSAAGGSEITMVDQEADAGSWFAGVAEGRLDARGDEDWFRFTLPAAGYISVDFASLTYGGLLPARVEVWSGDTLIDAADATTTTDPSIRTADKHPAGEYALRVAAPEPEMWGEGYFYRLSAHGTSVPR